MAERTPYDGKPYYCIDCGLGWNEYMACGEFDCLLETPGDALERAQKHQATDPTPAEPR